MISYIDGGEWSTLEKTTKLQQFTDKLDHRKLYQVHSWNQTNRNWGPSWHDRMVVGFTTTYAISAYPGLSTLSNVEGYFEKVGGER